MHMIYLGIAIHVAAGIFVYGYDDYLLDINIVHELIMPILINFQYEARPRARFDF